MEDIPSVIRQWSQVNPGDTVLTPVRGVHVLVEVLEKGENLSRVKDREKRYVRVADNAEQGYREQLIADDELVAVVVS